MIDELVMPDLSALLKVARLEHEIAQRKWRSAYATLDELKDEVPERFHNFPARAARGPVEAA